MSTAITKGSLSALAAQEGKSLAETFLGADAVILIDMSGSMSASDAAPSGRLTFGERPMMRSRYDAAEDELRRLQEQLPGKVAVVAFSSWPQFEPGGVPTRLGGGTDMAEALRFIHPVDGTGVRIILISDGMPDSEQETLKVAATFETAIDCIFIGPEGEEGQYFLKRLAEASGGRAFKSNSPGLLKDAVTHLLTG